MKVMKAVEGGCRRLRALSLVCITCVASSALAAEDRPFAAPEAAATAAASPAGGLAQVTLSLVLVLALVFAAAWLVRKLRGFGRFGAGAIEIVAEAPLGTKERAVLVQVGKQQLLLGVTAGQVNLLHTLAEPVVVSTERAVTGDQPQVPDFKAILRRSLGLK